MIQVQGNKEAIQINIGKEFKTNAPYSFSEKQQNEQWLFTL